MAMFKLSHQSGVVSSPIRYPGGAISNRNMNQNKLNTNQIKRICIWNLKTMTQTEKIPLLHKEMERIKISVRGVNEMRWHDPSYCGVDGHRVYYSEAMSGKYEHGVRPLVHRSVVKHVWNFVPVNDRISVSLVNTNSIQVYTPISEHSDKEVQEFYDQIHSTLRNIPKHKLLILMGKDR
ncbi:hypothetical protein Trydic_g22494 [Trypoxylus dichotomus]